MIPPPPPLPPLDESPPDGLRLLRRPGPPGLESEPGTGLPGLAGLHRAADPSQPPLPELALDGAPALRAARLALLQEAARRGLPLLAACDSDFADWPLGEPAALDALRAWAAPGRRLLLLAARAEGLARGPARFQAWRQHWDHLLELRELAPEDRAQLPHLLLLPGVAVLRQPVPQQPRAWRQSDPPALARAAQQLGDFLQRATPAAPRTVLGL